MLSEGDWLALSVSVQLALLTTVILIVICTPLAWWLARRRLPGQALLEAVLALPLVLPPSVLGFYLLIGLGPNGPGGWLANVVEQRSLAFTFTGLVVGSVVYSLPFVLQPLKNAFSAIDSKQLDMAAVTGAGPRDRFLSLVLPQCREGYVSAAILGFAHTLGEFGVVLMIGGSIPGETRTLAISIYDSVQSFDLNAANTMSLALLMFSLVAVATSLLLSGRKRRKP